MDICFLSVLKICLLFDSETVLFALIVSALLQVLLSHLGIVADKLREEFKASQLSDNPAKPRIQNTDEQEALSSDASVEDVEREADSYFQLMFSEQLPVETMVQTLARFKESSDRRYGNMYFLRVRSVMVQTFNGFPM